MGQNVKKEGASSLRGSSYVGEIRVQILEINKLEINSCPLSRVIELLLTGLNHDPGDEDLNPYHPVIHLICNFYYR
jgi:hypothetical protein